MVIHHEAAVNDGGGAPRDRETTPLHLKDVTEDALDPAEGIVRACVDPWTDDGTAGVPPGEGWITDTLKVAADYLREAAEELDRRADDPAAWEEFGWEDAGTYRDHLGRLEAVIARLTPALKAYEAARGRPWEVAH